MLRRFGEGASGEAADDSDEVAPGGGLSRSEEGVIELGGRRPLQKLPLCVDKFATFQLGQGSD